MTDPTARTLRLLGLLQARHSWTGGELAAELGVTDRTLRRDVARLRDLGYRVDGAAGSCGGYTLGRGSVVPPLLLELDEAMAVTLALVGAAAHGVLGDGQAGLRALGKLDDVLPTKVREQVRELRESVVVTAHPAAADGETVRLCAEAVRRRLRMRFAYTDRHGAPSERRVEPHLVSAVGRSWLLVCWDVDRADWRTFRLDRMAAVELTTWQFRPREGADEAARQALRPMPASAYRHRVVARVDCAAEVLRAELPPGAGSVHELEDGRCELSTGADDPDEAAWWLASLRHDLEVLGDEAVQDAVTLLAARLRRSVAPVR